MHRTLNTLVLFSSLLESLLFIVSQTTITFIAQDTTDVIALLFWSHGIEVVHMFVVYVCMPPVRMYFHATLHRTKISS